MKELDDKTKQKLRAIFLSPELGLRASVDPLYRLAKSRGLTVTKAQVKQFIDNQSLTQQFKGTKQDYGVIVAFHPRSNYMIDLLDVHQLRSANNNTRFLLVCIDVYSRYLMVEPLPNKNQRTVLTAFKKIVDENGEPDIVQSDSGSEFLNKEFQGYLRSIGAEHWKAEPDDHTKQAVVERVNRTIRELMERYLALKNTKKYIDVLPKFVLNINKTVNTGVGHKPIDIWQGKELPTNTDKMLDWIVTKRVGKRNFNIGDFVRVRLKRNRFEKGTKSKFSHDIYQIVGQDRNRFKLKNVDGTERKTLVKYNELLLVDLSTLEETRTTRNREKDKVERDRANDKLKRWLNKEGLD